MEISDETSPFKISFSSCLAYLVCSLDRDYIQWTKGTCYSFVETHMNMIPDNFVLLLYMPAKWMNAIELDIKFTCTIEFELNWCAAVLCIHNNDSPDVHQTTDFQTDSRWYTKRLSLKPMTLTYIRCRVISKNMFVTSGISQRIIFILHHFFHTVGWACKESVVNSFI